MMKYFMVFLMAGIALTFFAPTIGADETYNLKPDTLISGQYIVYDKKGDRRGTLQPDRLIKGQYILKLNEGTGSRLQNAPHFLKGK